MTYLTRNRARSIATRVSSELQMEDPIRQDDVIGIITSHTAEWAEERLAAKYGQQFSVRLIKLVRQYAGSEEAQ